MTARTKKVLAPVLVALVILGVVAYLHNRGTTELQDLKGRDFVELGEFQTLRGNIYPDRGEWFLQTGDSAYELHLGDHTHRERTGIRLEEGKTATVSGYVYSQRGADFIDLAVCTVQMDGEKYRFRQDDGTPMWWGQGGGDRDGQGIGSGLGGGDGTGSGDGAGRNLTGQGRNQ